MLSGPVVVDETRVHVPGLGDGVVRQIVTQRGYAFGASLLLPAQIIVQLDDGRRAARTYVELEPVASS